MKYIYIYLGAQLKGDEKIPEDAIKAWGEYKEKLGGKLFDMGNPFGKRQKVGEMKGKLEGKECNDQCDECCNTYTRGYSIVEATSLEEAVKMTEGNPALMDGQIDVIELVEVPKV